MVKHGFPSMGLFFTHERFGQPQILAGLLLLAFLAQCLWLVQRASLTSEPTTSERFRVTEGVRQWRGGAVAGTGAAAADRSANEFAPPELDENEGYDPHHSPLWYLVAAAPLLGWRQPLQADFISRGQWLAQRWLQCVPYLIFGVLLGASLWYVSRRLYGNAGGYIALTLYCFSPAIIRASALWNAQPEMGAAFGAFGAIFTAIAVAHTLYAPREVVLWNWRRILLLGVSLALAVGSQFSLLVVAPAALLFLGYLAPERRRAALGIWMAACVVALGLLYTGYFFHLGSFWRGLRHAEFFPVTWPAFGMMRAYQQLFSNLSQGSPALVIVLPIALVVYVVWRRARYFGNTAPLMVAALLLILGVGSPHYPGLGFQLVALPFLFVFVAGVSADLLETQYRNLVLACVGGLLMAYAIWNVMAVVPVWQG
jgi:predicted membrane protein